jgi:hypothetical protein
MSLISLTKRQTGFFGFSTIVPNYSNNTTTPNANRFVVDSSSNVYFTASSGLGANAIYKTTIYGDTPTLFAGSSSGQGGKNTTYTPYTSYLFSNIQDLAIDSNNVLYTLDSNCITYFTTTGSQLASNYTLDNSSNYTRFAVDPSGYRIVAWTPTSSGTSKFTFYLGNGPGSGLVYNSITVNLTPNASPFFPTNSSAFWLPGGGLNNFYVTVPYGVKVGPTGSSNDPNPVYQISVLQLGSNNLFNNPLTLDGSSVVVQSNSLSNMIFNTATTGYSLSANQGRGSNLINAVTINSNAMTITTSNVYTDTATNKLDSTGHLGVYSDSNNTALILAVGTGGQGSTINQLLALQTMY